MLGDMVQIRQAGTEARCEEKRGKSEMVEG